MNAAVLKTAEPLRVPWVRIPPSPNPCTDKWALWVCLRCLQGPGWSRAPHEQPRVVIRRRFLSVVALLAAAEPLATSARQNLLSAGSPSPPTAGHEFVADTSLPSSPDLSNFVALSTILTGFTDLERDVAGAYLRSIRADAAQSSALDDLIARSGIASSDPPKTLAQLSAKGVFAAPESLALTSLILAHWFSGTYSQDRGVVTQTWDTALAWRACTFTKPPATCGGQIGYWAKAPA